MAFSRKLDARPKEPIPLPPSHKIGKGMEFLGMFAPLCGANIPKNLGLNRHVVVKLRQSLSCKRHKTNSLLDFYWWRL
jgi:hypothetical protein